MNFCNPNFQTNSETFIVCTTSNMSKNRRIVCWIGLLIQIAAGTISPRKYRWGIKVMTTRIAFLGRSLLQSYVTSKLEMNEMNEMEWNEMTWTIDNTNIVRINEWINEWMDDRMIDWLIYWLTGWLIACLLDWLIDWLIDRLIDRLIDLIDWLSDWWIYWLIFVWLNKWFVGWLVVISLIGMIWLMNFRQNQTNNVNEVTFYIHNTYISHAIHGTGRFTYMNICMVGEWLFVLMINVGPNI